LSDRYDLITTMNATYLVERKNGGLIHANEV